MGRKKREKKRFIDADKKYGSVVVSKFINIVMMGGKKSLALKIVYGAMDELAKKVGIKNALEAFLQALENAKPSVEVKSRRIGGATYQVPSEIMADRRVALAMRWIVKHARAKNGRPMLAALASELVECFNKQGATIKKKEDTHRMAEANRAFAHYKW